MSKKKKPRPVTADILFVFLSQAKSLASREQEDQHKISIRDPYSRKHLKTFVKFIDNVGMDGVEALVAMQELDAQSCYQYYRSREATYRGGKHVVKPEPDWGAKSFLPLPWAYHYTPSTNFTKVMPKTKVLASLMRAWAQWVVQGAMPASKDWWQENYPHANDTINKVLDNTMADILLLKVFKQQMLDADICKTDALFLYQNGVFMACLGGKHRIDLSRLIALNQTSYPNLNLSKDKENILEVHLEPGYPQACPHPWPPTKTSKKCPNCLPKNEEEAKIAAQLILDAPPNHGNQVVYNKYDRIVHPRASSPEPHTSPAGSDDEQEDEGDEQKDSEEVDKDQEEQEEQEEQKEQEDKDQEEQEEKEEEEEQEEEEEEEEEDTKAKRVQEEGMEHARASDNHVC